MTRFCRTRLSTQLMWVFLLVLVVVIGTLGAIHARSQVAAQQAAQLTEVTNVVKSIATAIREDAYGHDYVTIEKTLLDFPALNLIERITVVDTHGHILTEVERATDGSYRASYRYGSEPINVGEGQATASAAGLEVWQPVGFAGQRLAWLHAYSGRGATAAVLREVVEEMVVLGLLIFVVAGLSLYLFLHYRLRSLTTIADFSRRLAVEAGGQLGGRDYPSELAQLVNALNWASAEVERQRRALAAYGSELEARVAERTAELASARDQALKSSAAKSEFLSRMSHELRTPLNAVLGFAQLLELDADQFTQNHRESISEIVSAGRHLLDMVNEVLDLARIESGKLQVVLQPHDLAPVVEGVVAMLTPLAVKRGVSLQLAGQSPAAVCDLMRAKQVLVNVISNAIKYNKPGGQVVITLSSEPDWSVVEVRDTGVGIQTQDRVRIFRAFERVESSLFTEGSGVGLAVTQQLMVMMHGTVRVVSEPGVGSTFTLAFPAVR